MLLNAITLGYAIPNNDFEATVHSSFRSAANLRREGDPYLLTLLLSSETDLPQGIRVNAPPGFTFEDLPVNERLICRDEVLQCEKFPLTVDLRRGVRWKSDLLAFSTETTDLAFSARWDKVWQTLNDQQRQTGAELVAEYFRQPGGIVSAMTRRLVEGMNGLITSTRNNALDTGGSVTALLGLGSGLTPSGDDLLVGYMAGLICRAGRNQDRNKFISDLGRTLTDLSFKTTDISRTYLFHATNGQFSKNLTRLAEAICTGIDPDQLVEIALAAMRMGHSSGMDAVTGLLLGLEAWEGTSGTRACAGA